MGTRDEYQSLRDELLREYQREVNLSTLVFSATGVIIATGFTAQNPHPIVFLIPLSILALLLYQLVNAQRSIFTISVYIRVLLNLTKTLVNIGRRP